MNEIVCGFVGIAAIIMAWWKDDPIAYIDEVVLILGSMGCPAVISKILGILAVIIAIYREYYVKKGWFG